MVLDVGVGIGFCAGLMLGAEKREDETRCVLSFLALTICLSLFRLLHRHDGLGEEHLLGRHGRLLLLGGVAMEVPRDSARSARTVEAGVIAKGLWGESCNRYTILDLKTCLVVGNGLQCIYRRRGNSVVAAVSGAAPPRAEFVRTRGFTGAITEHDIGSRI